MPMPANNTLSEPLPLTNPRFGEAVHWMFPDDFMEHVRIEDRGDGPALVWWSLPAAIPTEDDVTAALQAKDWKATQDTCRAMLDHSSWTQLPEAGLSAEERAPWDEFRRQCCAALRSKMMPEGFVMPVAP
jgi:hypothetical protein